MALKSTITLCSLLLSLLSVSLHAQERDKIVLAAGDNVSKPWSKEDVFISQVSSSCSDHYGDRMMKDVHVGEWLDPVDRQSSLKSAKQNSVNYVVVLIANENEDDPQLLDIEMTLIELVEDPESFVKLQENQRISLVQNMTIDPDEWSPERVERWLQASLYQEVEHIDETGEPRKRQLLELNFIDFGSAEERKFTSYLTEYFMEASPDATMPYLSKIQEEYRLCIVAPDGDKDAMAVEFDKRSGNAGVSFHGQTIYFNPRESGMGSREELAKVVCEHLDLEVEEQVPASNSISRPGPAASFALVLSTSNTANECPNRHESILRAIAEDIAGVMNRRKQVYKNYIFEGYFIDRVPSQSAVPVSIIISSGDTDGGGCDDSEFGITLGASEHGTLQYIINDPAYRIELAPSFLVEINPMLGISNGGG